MTLFLLILDYNTTSDGWLEWNGNQYFFNKQEMAVEDARHFCRQRHGDLVSIQSEAESIFLWKRVSSDMFTTLSKSNLVFRK